MLSILTLCALSFPLAAQEAAPVSDAVKTPQEFITAQSLLAHPDFISGNYEAAREDWLSMLEHQPNSKHAEAALLMVQFVGPGCATPLDFSRLGRIESELSDGSAIEVLHNIQLGLIRDSLWRQNPLPLPADIHKGWGKHWRLAGPFGTLDDPFPLSRKMASGPGESMPNGRGEMIQWQSVERTPNKRTAPVDRSYEANGGTMMATAFLQWEEAGPLYLEVRSRNTFEFWWNGQRHLNIKRDNYEQSGTTFRFLVQPESGAWNTALFRWASSDFFAPALRFFHLDGSPATIQEADPTTFPVQFAWNYKPTVFSSQSQPPQPGAVVSSWDDLLLMCQDIFHNQPPSALAWKAPNDNPQDSLTNAYHQWHLTALGAAGHFSASEKRRAQMATLERLERGQKTWAAAEVGRAQLLIQDDKPAEALAAIENAILACPNSITLAAIQAKVLGKLDAQHTLGRKAALANAMRWPHHHLAWTQLCEWSKQAPEKQRFYRKRALAANGFNQAYANARAQEIAMQGGEKLAALRARLADLNEAFPFDFPRRMQRQLWSLLGESELELEHLRHEHAQRPGDITAKASLAWELMRLGNFDEAQILLHGVLETTPGDHGARRALEFLGDAHDQAEDFFAEFGPDVESAIASTPEADDKSGTSTALVLDHGMLYYLPDGAASYRNHTITTALDAQGTRAMHEQRAATFVHTVRVRDASGRFYEPNLVEDNWVMPSLDPGDSVEVIYDQYHASTDGAAPTAAQWKFASFDSPYLISRYVVYIPDGLPGELRLHRFDGEHEVVPWNQGKVHIFTRNSVRFQHEPLRPTDHELLPQLIQGEDTPLEWRVSLYRNWLNRRSSLPADIADMLRADVLSGIDPSLSKHMQAKAIYAAVREHILEWKGSSDVIDAWLERTGDPLPVLAAFYRLADIPFSWILVNDTLPELTPNIAKFETGDEFTLPGIYLPAESTDGNDQWLFPTNRGAPFGVMPAHLAGTQALILDEQGSWAETTLPNDALADSWNFDLILTYTLRSDHTATTTGEFRMTGAEGSSTRERFSQQEPAQLDQISRQIAGQFVNGLNLESATFPDLKVASAPLRLSFQGSVPNFVRQSGDKFGCRLQIPDLQLSAMLGSPEREWPLAFRQQTRRRTKIRLVPPEGWSFEYGPTSNQIKEQAFLYDFVVNDVDGALEVTRTLTSRGLWLEPEEVSAFLERITFAEKEEKRAVRLIPPPAEPEASAEASPLQTDNP